MILSRAIFDLPTFKALFAVVAAFAAPVLPQQKEPATALAPFTQNVPNSVVKIPMVPIKGGNVKIGDKTVVVKPFFIASTETTWEAFDAFIASGPASPAYDQTEFAPDAIARPSKSYSLPDLGWGHNGYPAINLTSTTVEMYCRWLSQATKKKYRLPTEAEWELAALAGQSGAWKMAAADLEKSAWYVANSRGTTHPVGKKLPNKFGLHDMIGNVAEWATDLKGEPVLCGGSFMDPADDLSPSKRRYYSPDWQETDPQIPKSRWWLADGPFAGFRVVCEP